MSPNRFVASFAAGVLFTSLAAAQVAISTHSGLVQFTLGSVFLADKPLKKTATNLVEIKNGEVLRTGADGNAEVLLTPGVFLRLGNNASIRMDSNLLANTRVTLLSGSAMLECDELLEGNAVAFTVGSYPVEFHKKGLYRLDAEPPGVASIKGEAFIAGNLNAIVKQGKFVALNTAVPEPEKFKVNKKHDLYAFSKARSEDSVYATGVTSSSLYSSGYRGCTGSAWYLMSGVGMYSYLPCQGMFSNPFGYSFLGLNYGYLWDGPGFYMAPYGYYGSGFYGVPGGYVTGGGGGSRVGGRQAAVNSTDPHKAVRAAVPVYVGPGIQQTRPAPTVGFRNGAPQIQAFRSIAGPSVRNSAAFSHPGSSMRAAPDPYGGAGMPSAAGPMGAQRSPAMGAPSPAPTMRSAPTTAAPAPAPAPSSGGSRGGYTGGVRGR